MTLKATLIDTRPSYASIVVGSKISPENKSKVQGARMKESASPQGGPVQETMTAHKHVIKEKLKSDLACSSSIDKKADIADKEETKKSQFELTKGYELSIESEKENKERKPVFAQEMLLKEEKTCSFNEQATLNKQFLFEDWSKQNPEKKRMYKSDTEGWFTRVPAQKKQRNERAPQRTPPTQWSSFAERSKQVQAVRGRESKRVYQGGRQTIVYSNSRGSGSINRYRQTKDTGRAPQSNRAASLGASVSRELEGSNPSSVSTTYFSPQTEHYLDTAVFSPDLHPPPPPPRSLPYSYRDILAKNLSQTSPNKLGSVPPQGDRNVSLKDGEFEGLTSKSEEKSDESSNMEIPDGNETQSAIIGTECTSQEMVFHVSSKPDVICRPVEIDEPKMDASNQSFNIIDSSAKSPRSSECSFIGQQSLDQVSHIDDKTFILDKSTESFTSDNKAAIKSPNTKNVSIQSNINSSFIKNDCKEFSKVSASDAGKLIHSDSNSSVSNAIKKTDALELSTSSSFHSAWDKSASLKEIKSSELSSVISEKSKTNGDDQSGNIKGQTVSENVNLSFAVDMKDIVNLNKMSDNMSIDISLVSDSCPAPPPTPNKNTFDSMESSTISEHSSLDILSSAVKELEMHSLTKFEFDTTDTVLKPFADTTSASEANITDKIHDIYELSVASEKNESGSINSLSEKSSFKSESIPLTKADESCSSPTQKANLKVDESTELISSISGLTERWKNKVCDGASLVTMAGEDATENSDNIKQINVSSEVCCESPKENKQIPPPVTVCESTQQSNGWTKKSNPIGNDMLTTMSEQMALSKDKPQLITAAKISSFSLSMEPSANDIWSTDQNRKQLNIQESLLKLDKPDGSLTSLLKTSEQSARATTTSAFPDLKINLETTANLVPTEVTPVSATKENKLTTSEPILLNATPRISLPANTQDSYNMNQNSVLPGRSPNVLSNMPNIMPNPNINPYVHQNPISLANQISLTGQELDYSHITRLTSGQAMNLAQQQHVNYIQHPSTAMQYPPNLFDPRWQRNYALDVNQSEWLNINRFHNNERDFTRPPLHLSQPLNMFSYPPPNLPAQKDNFFSGFNYPPPPFQHGYRFPTHPGFIQRPPPIAPLNSAFYNRNGDQRNPTPIRPFHRESPVRKEQGFSTLSGKIEADRQRPVHQTQFKEISAKGTSGELYQSLSADRYAAHGGKNRNSNTSNSIDPNIDYMSYKQDIVHQESSDQTWKPKNVYDKRSYNGRKGYRQDQREDTGYTNLDQDSFVDEPMVTRRKTPLKCPVTLENVKVNKGQISEQKQYSAERQKSEMMNYGNPTEPFSQNPFCQNYPRSPEETVYNVLPNYPYSNNGKDLVSAALEYNIERCDYDDPQMGHAVSNFDALQEFCSGGWKYYHDAISAQSGLRIHQSTYVPYPNPCGNGPTTYWSTNDVRARVQWVGYKKAHEMYTAKISSQRTLRMDVTVVCSKGTALCCNSDILSTCSNYFHDRIYDRNEEYITIYVDVPSKIMKHFLQMMSCGEAFVPIIDINEVIMKSAVYLNLNM